MAGLEQLLVVRSSLVVGLQDLGRIPVVLVGALGMEVAQAILGGTGGV